MKRKQLCELEDQSWFPDSFRIAMTKLLRILHNITGCHDVLFASIKKALQTTGERAILDLGSGAGGPLPELFNRLKAEHPDLTVRLSDLYPNKTYIEQLNATAPEGLSYFHESVDAGNLENAPEGMKTMINSYHHIPPSVAQKILHEAQDRKSAIFIYEMAENKLPFIL